MINDEEIWASIHIPKKSQKPLLINGKALALHFAYYTQRDVNDNGKSLDQRLNEFV